MNRYFKPLISIANQKSNCLVNCLRNNSSTARRTVTLIPGDGIGPEISSAVQKIFSTANVPIDWDVVDVTPERKPDGRFSIPQKAIDSVTKNKIGLKGPLATPVYRINENLNYMLLNFFFF